VCAAFGGGGAFARSRDFALASENADFSLLLVLILLFVAANSNLRDSFSIPHHASTVFNQVYERYIIDSALRSRISQAFAIAFV
jgi:hypothetical protein